MGSFNLEIPDEYLNNSEDFGFTTVDSDEFDQQNQQEREVAEEVAGEVASSVVNKINLLEGKINAVLLRLEDNTGDDNLLQNADFSRIEEKIDQILAMENDELAQSIQEQGASIRAVIDEVEERKSKLDEEYREKLSEVEQLVLPLLINLTKNPEREYLLWPGRAEKVQQHIKKVLEVTRG